MTDNNITKLALNEVFVFGANEAGRHGAGAAKAALRFGAEYGQGEGIQGKSYGIPTKDTTVTRALTIDEIRPYVDRFIKFATVNPSFNFLVTEIGCGHAGLTPEQVAPLFGEAKNITNIHLPKRFWEILI